MPYQHGVRVLERETSLSSPILGTTGLQVIFGTAPINLADDPTAVVNKPVIAYTWAEAVAQLGYSDDYESYTLCPSMYACFKAFGVAPVIFVNVLDPSNTDHVTAVTEATSIAISKLQGTLKVKGVLKSTVVLKNGNSALTLGTDYALSFDDDGYLVITLTSTGAAASATTVSVASYTKLKPSGVDADDIIGATSASGAETGLEVLRQVYPKFGMTPGLILAPGWSQNANVAVVIAAKCEEINGYFRAEAYVDIDSSSTGCRVYTNVKTAKDNAGISSKHVMALWPCVKIGDKVFWMSAIMGALTAYTDANNDDVPSLSPSNKALPITGTCLADGTEVNLDQVQGNTVNGFGVTTAINVNGWRSWGNNSAAYPSTTDPKDRWFAVRRFFSWQANTFILTYFQQVDDPGDYRLIESIVDAENIRGNSLAAQGKCAAMSIEYLESENTAEDILDGTIQFHQHLAPYIPAEDIVNTLEFDPDALLASLTGGES